MKKRQADHTITRMLNKLIMNTATEKKRKAKIKKCSKKPMGDTSKIDVDLEHEKITN